MKKYIINFFITCCFLNVNAQITVTDVNIANIGDQIGQSEDENSFTLIDVGAAGGNQIWDFSFLQSDQSVISSVESPSMMPHGASYPDANICIVTDNEFIYAEKNTSGIYVLGVDDSTFQQSLLLLPFPLTYGSSVTDGPVLFLDSVVSGPAVNFLLQSQGISPFMLTGGLAHIADTLNIQAEGTANYQVDAWGEVILPMGTFDALRLKIDRSTSTNISVYCIDTITGANSAWYPLPFGDVDNEISYQWYSNNSSAKYFLTEVYVDSYGDPEGNIIFLDNVVSKTQDFSKIDINVFPIPAKNKVFIELGENNDVDIKLIDINGKLMFNATSLTNNYVLDMTNYQSGNYFLNIKFQNGQEINKKLFLE